MDLYHVMNRGVEKRDLFLEDIDYVRFIHNLYEFNDTAPANTNAGYHFKFRDIVSLYIPKERDKIVDIHGWCLMKNHYHLLLSERVENGLTKFIRKLNIGYAKFFNEKYERSGFLFQGRTKKVLIERDQQFNYILHYIHFNPLDYLPGAERWRIRNGSAPLSADAALAFLKEYKWSSYLDYIGEKNFPSVLTTSLFKDAFGNYREAAADFIGTVNDAFENKNALFLE